MAHSGAVESALVATAPRARKSASAALGDPKLALRRGRGRWRHSTEFAELFADSVRHWPWVPRFAHLLIDQSQVIPQAVRGELHGRIAQLMMMERCRDQEVI